SQQVPSPSTASLATVIFRDYFLILAKSAVQAAQNLLKSYPYAVQPGDSLLSIAKQFSTTYQYTIQHGDTLGIISGHTGVAGRAIQAANPGSNFTAARDKLSIPPAFVDADYITATNDTIVTIASPFGISTDSIVTANPKINFYDGNNNPVVFVAGVKILVPLPAMLFSLAASLATKSILNTSTTLTLRSCNYQVRAGDTLQSIATTFGKTDPATLANLNSGTVGILVTGAVISIASGSGPFQSTYVLPQAPSGAPDPVSLTAAWFYTRNLGTVNAPTAAWFVLQIQAFNPTVDFTQPLPAGKRLNIPNVYMSSQGILSYYGLLLEYT